MATGKHILVIEDDREIAATMRSILEGAGFEIAHAPNGIEGQRLVESVKPDLIITDMMMPKMGGFPVLEFLRTLSDAPPVIMVTANEGGRHKAYAEMLGVVDYLRKPFAMDVLLEAVNRALESSPTKEAEERGAKSGPLKRNRSSSKSSD
ncbi:MAG: response regulator [Planctomycetaceae bacterium]|nr:response regulator [Planctomycetaceae bacterium]